MRMLLIHARRFEYHVVKKAIRSAEKLGDDKGRLEAENTLVAFITVEKQDESNIPLLVEKASSEILGVYGKVKAASIILYPYAHLSSSLSSPETAVEVLRRLEDALAERNVKVHRAPFGWYKGFLIECYGHPLSELSRSIRIGGEAKPAYHLYVPGEGVKPLSGGEPLKNAESRASSRAAEFSRKFGLDPMDPWILKGRAEEIMKLAEEKAVKLLEKLVGRADKVSVRCVENKCMGCLTPLEKLPAADNRPLIMSIEYAGRGECRGQGAVRPLRSIAARMRVGSMEEAYRLIAEALRISEENLPSLKNSSTTLLIDANKENLNTAEGIAEALGLQGVIRAWSGRCGRKISVDVFLGEEGLLASILSAVIMPAGGNVDLLVSIPRSLEDLFYLHMLRAALDEAEGRTPSLPLWLSPIQVRIIPVSERNMGYAGRIASMLRARGVRVDVDAGGGLGRRIRRAGVEWIPFIAVIGDREEETGTINVRIRSENKQVSVTPEELLEILASAGGVRE